MTATTQGIATVGSVINIMPARRRAKAYLRNKRSGERWTLPVIGWAIVVSCTRIEDPNWQSGSDYETELEPVVLVDDSFPTPLGTHLRVHLLDCELVRVRP